MCCALQRDAQTVSRGTEAMVVCASPADRVDLTAFLSRARTVSSCSAISAISELSEYSEEEHDVLLPAVTVASATTMATGRVIEQMVIGSPLDCPPGAYGRRAGGGRVRFLSGSDDSCSSSTFTEVGREGGWGRGGEGDVGTPPVFISSLIKWCLLVTLVVNLKPSTRLMEVGMERGRTHR